MPHLVELVVLLNGVEGRLHRLLADGVVSSDAETEATELLYCGVDCTGIATLRQQLFHPNTTCLVSHRPGVGR